MLTIFFAFLLLFPVSYISAKNSDFWYNKSMTNNVENDGLALKIFQNQCCDNCSCKKDLENESKKISENDSMGREKFWKDLGRP